MSNKLAVLQILCGPLHPSKTEMETMSWLVWHGVALEDLQPMLMEIRQITGDVPTYTSQGDKGRRALSEMAQHFPSRSVSVFHAVEDAHGSIVVPVLERSMVEKILELMRRYNPSEIIPALRTARPPGLAQHDLTERRR